MSHHYLRRAYNIDDIRKLARGRLPKGIYESIEGGTEDEIATANNRASFNRIKFSPRVFADVSHISTDIELFGEKLAMPLGIAPTGSAGLVWFQGKSNWPGRRPNVTCRSLSLRAHSVPSSQLRRKRAAIYGCSFMYGETGSSRTS